MALAATACCCRTVHLANPATCMRHLQAIRQLWSVQEACSAATAWDGTQRRQLGLQQQKEQLLHGSQSTP